MGNKVIISRVLGNELKPREIAGAKIKILDRILDIEAKQSRRIDCFWVVNRVYDESLLNGYLRLLDNYGQKYDIIPFDLSEYRKITSFEGKITYGTNVNAARNHGIRLCWQTHDFVIAADGDCYFPERFIEPLLKQIDEDQLSNPTRQYYSVPAKRLHYLDDESVLNKARFEEHLLVLRKDAQELFNEKMFFGNGDAIELFRRVGYKTEKGTCVLQSDRSKVLDGFMVALAYSENKVVEVNLKNRMQARDLSLKNMAREMDSLAG